MSSLDAEPKDLRYAVADIVLDVGQRRATRHGSELPLSKLSFGLLLALVRAAPNLLTHDELIASVWGAGRIITPENLGKRVLLLREALGDNADVPRYVETVRGQGYRLLSEVRQLESPRAAQAAPRAGRANGAARWGGAAIVAAIVALVWFVGTGLYGDRDTPRSHVVFEITPNTPLSVAPVRIIDISADGRRVAYVTRGNSIAVRTLDRLEPTILPDLGIHIHSPSFSPDGEQLAYVDGGILRRVAVTGAGPLTAVADILEVPNGDIKWADDETIIVANERGLMRVPETGGEVEVLLEPNADEGEQSFSTPFLLPGRDKILFSILPSRPKTPARIATFDLRTRERHIVLDQGRRPYYTSTGQLVYVSGDTLHSVRFDPDRAVTRGEPTSLDVQVLGNNMSVSSTGTLAYVAGRQAGLGGLALVDRAGLATRLAVPALGYTYPRVSPDGSKIALDVRGPVSDIHYWDLERSLMVAVTNDPAENVLPTWHPSSRLIAYGDARSGSANVFIQDIQGGGDPTPVRPSERRQVPSDFSPDGRFLLIAEYGSNGAWSLYAWDFEQGEMLELLTDGFNYMNSVFSPDGHWIAYQSNESGPHEVWVRPFPSVRDGRWKISAEGGAQPTWPRESGEIYYLNPAFQLMAVGVSAGPKLEPSAPQSIIDLSPYLAGSYDNGARRYDWWHDATQVLVPMPLTKIPDGERPRIVVDVDWLASVPSR